MNCSFCATQLPDDAVYCAECGRPALSRRARRGTAGAESTAPTVAGTARSATKSSSAFLGALRRRKHVSAETESDVTSEITPAVETIVEIATVPPGAESDAYAPIAAVPEPSGQALQLGQPLTLHIPSSVVDVHDGGMHGDANISEDVADSMSFDGANRHGESFPLDEDGPYDEIAEPVTTIPHDDEPIGSDDTVTDGEGSRPQDNDAERFSDHQQNTAEPVRSSPEPLVEPAPLQRSTFEPDLSKVGRPDEIPHEAEPLRVKPVRPLGDETVFTTAERLRASAFAPLASERVDNRPAPPARDAENDESGLSASEPEGYGTQPRIVAATENTTDDRAGVAPDKVDSKEPPGASTQSVDSCAQCGVELSDSDIFCGSCGFVKHGVGPGSRSQPAAPDHSPRGIPAPSERPAEVAQVESFEVVGRSDSNPDDEAKHNVSDDNGAELIDAARSPLEPSTPEVHLTESSSERPLVVTGAITVVESEQREPESLEIPAPRASVNAPSTVETSESETVAAPTESELNVAGEAIPLIEPGDELPAPTLAVSGGSERPGDSSTSEHPNSAGDADDAPPAKNHTDDAPARGVAPESSPELREDAATPSASSAPAFSVLAPPPKSNQRVELPISPPAPLASLGADDADIEDTRIVERSVTGSRFVLQFSTGDSVIVTGTGLVGRNPIPEPSEKFDIVVPITDPSKSVSKTHLEFGQMSGVFWISDRYSGNGTIVREPGVEPRRCEAGKRYRVVRGTRVEIGEQFFIVS